MVTVMVAHSEERIMRRDLVPPRYTIEAVLTLEQGEHRLEDFGLTVWVWPDGEVDLLDFEDDHYFIL